MKNVRLVLVAVIILLAQTGIMMAQRDMVGNPEIGNHQRKGMDKHMFIPGLTDDQAAKIKDLHLNLLKEIQPLQNQLGELKAKQKSLISVDKADMKAIDGNIEEISKLQTQIMKATVHHRLQVRSLLNDEQKLYFDAHGKGGKGQHKFYSHKEE
jgi:Spy/CpxP family protein refolding chaperone